ncbi:MAG: hypothetical protein AAFN18_10965 [Cyanobacteria bacterium J06554_6]
MTNGSISAVLNSNASKDTCIIEFDVEEIDLTHVNTTDGVVARYDNTTSDFASTDQSGTPETADEDDAQLVVVSPLDVSKDFQAYRVGAGGTSTVVIQLTNSLPGTDLTGVTFSDSWGAGEDFTIANPANPLSSCGGTVTATPGSKTFTLTGGTIPQAVGDVFGLCEIRVDVVMGTGSDANFTNEIERGDVTSNQGFSNSFDRSDQLRRRAKTIDVVKEFSDTTIQIGDPTTLTVTIRNPSNGIPLTDVGFTDTMPLGEMVVFKTPNASTTCPGTDVATEPTTPGPMVITTVPPTVTANAGENTFTLSGASLRNNRECTVTVQVTRLTTSNAINEIGAGGISSKENITNPVEARATLNAQAALRLSKSFGDSNIDGGKTTTLTINLQNRTGETLTNATVTDNLPTVTPATTPPGQMLIAPVPNPQVVTAANCIGLDASEITAVAGSTQVSISSTAGLSIPANATCTISVDVTANKQGNYDNEIPRGGATAELSGYPNPPTIGSNDASATLTVDSDSLPPELLLVKRITAVNGDRITGFDDGTGTEDNDPHWPANLLEGVIEYNTPVVPGDELEYTIYYLNTGLGSASNVMICDRVPAYTTFLPNGYNAGPAQATGGLTGADRGITLAEGNSEVSLTNANDGDTGYYFAPGTDPDGVFPGITCNGDSSNGTVVVSVPNQVPAATGAGTPATSYGHIRFKATVR